MVFHPIKVGSRSQGLEDALGPHSLCNTQQPVWVSVETACRRRWPPALESRPRADASSGLLPSPSTLPPRPPSPTHQFRVGSIHLDSGPRSSRRQTVAVLAQAAPAFPQGWKCGAFTCCIPFLSSPKHHIYLRSSLYHEFHNSSLSFLLSTAHCQHPHSTGSSPRRSTADPAPY